MIYLRTSDRRTVRRHVEDRAMQVESQISVTSEQDTYPLQGLHGKEICLLQDARYETFGLQWDSWLRWGEGETVKVKLPRNVFAESFEYRGTVPLFATMATPFSYPFAEAKKTGRNVEYESKQFRSRWVTVQFKNAIPESERDSSLDPCRRCGAVWYAAVVPASVRSSAGLDPHASVQPVVHDDPASSCDEPPQKVPKVDLPAAAQGVNDELSVQSSRNDRFEKLQSLMKWRRDGLVDSPEFKAAKRELLGL